MKKNLILIVVSIFWLLFINGCTTQNQKTNVNTVSQKPSVTTPAQQVNVVAQPPSLDKMNKDLGKSISTILRENQGATRHDSNTALLGRGGIFGGGQYFGYNWSFQNDKCIQVNYLLPYSDQAWNNWIENANSIYGEGKRLFDVKKEKEVVVLWFLNGGVKLNLIRGDGAPLIAFVVQNFPGYTIKEDVLKLLNGHDDLVWSVAYNQTGSQIASSSGNSVKLWDTETGNELRTFVSGINKGGMAVCFSPNGNNLAVGTFDKVIRIYNISNGREILTLRSQESISSIAYSPDGSKIVSVSGSLGDSTAKIWNAANGNLLINQTLGRINRFTGRPLASMKSVKFSPNGNAIIIADSFGDIIILDANTGRTIRTISMGNDGVESVDVSRDGRLIISGSRDSIKIFDFNSGILIRNLPIKDGKINNVFFSLDNKTIISGGGDEGIRFWDIETGRVKNTIIWNRSDIMSMSLSPNGKYIVTGGGLTSGDYSIKIWNIE